MRVTDAEIRAGEVIFESKCGGYDSKHINNLANREVPSATLDKIEHGCPLEAIDEIGREFPICKYATQITIHGKFPELTTRRAGGSFGYVNLCRNKNGSIGVRWEAIDNAKKEKLFSVLHIVKGWGIVHNSSTYRMEKMKLLNKENAETVLAEFKAEAERINQYNHLFFGKAVVMAVPTLFGKVAVLYVCVNAYYERNYTALLEGLADMPMSEIDAKLAEHDAEQKRIEAEREERMRKWREEYRQKIAAVKAENEKWLAENPAPFPKAADDYQPKAGDIICMPKYDGYGDEARIIGWEYFVLSKSFGRIIITPSDANGVKERFARGREFDSRGKGYYVKPTAKPAPVPVTPSVTPRSSDIAPSAAHAVAGGVMVRENTAKGGIEIKFSTRPSDTVLADLKANGWRWTRFNGGLWYNRATETTRAYAQRFVA